MVLLFYYNPVLVLFSFLQSFAKAESPARAVQVATCRLQSVRSERRLLDSNTYLWVCMCVHTEAHTHTRTTAMLYMG